MIDAATRPLLWAGLSAFLFALILGLAFRKLVTGELVDLIYNPLSAVGAFLLFMMSVADRKTVTLNRQISEVTSRVAHLRKGARISNAGPPLPYFRARQQRLESERIVSPQKLA